MPSMYYGNATELILAEIPSITCREKVAIIQKEYYTEGILSNNSSKCFVTYILEERIHTTG